MKDNTAPIESITATSSLGETINGSGVSIISVKGTLNNGLEADMSRATVTYTVVEGDSVEVFDTNKVRAVGTGTSVVEIKAELSGGSATTRLTFQADVNAVFIPPTIVYDLRGTGNSGNRRNSTSAYTEPIACGNNWEIAEELCAENMRQGQRDEINWQDYGLSCATRAIGDDVGLRLVIPNSGWYSFAMSGLGYASGGTAAIYLNNVYLGEYNYYSDVFLQNKGNTAMRTVYLEAGTHTLLMRTVGGIRGYYQYPATITLKGVATIPHCRLSACDGG